MNIFLCGSRDGTIKVGDRLLGIDGQRLTGLSLCEAERLLVAPNGGKPVWLSVEYDISVMTGMRAAGPLLVEVEAPEGKTDLGLSLMNSISGVIISTVRAASVAERYYIAHQKPLSILKNSLASRTCLSANALKQ